jgi:ribonuclease BN (tRNA processing enzyme)
MMLTVPGCDTPFPRPDRPCSGYLLQAGNENIWVDAGSGTLAELQRHVELADVGTIWISHLHPDHWVDLVAAWNAYINDNALPHPKVFGAPGLADRLDAALSQVGAAAKVFDTHEVHDQLETVVGPVRLRAFEMRHSVPTFGVRAACGGRVLGYSADTGPCDALMELARGAQVLLVEAEASEPQQFHCTPEDAAGVAEERAILTHLGPGLQPAEALARFRSRSSVQVDVARVGARFVV